LEARWRAWRLGGASSDGVGAGSGAETARKSGIGSGTAGEPVELGTRSRPKASRNITPYQSRAAPAARIHGC